MTTITLGWGFAAALFAWSALVFWLGRSSAARRSSGDLAGPPRSNAALRPAPVASLSLETRSAIRGELARGNKIAAIKLMHEASGLGLAEAKRAVEAMAPR